MGYYAHLITDAEFQRYIRDEDRIKASWDRIKLHPELSKQAVGMEETWDSVKKLIGGRERMKDIYAIEAGLFRSKSGIRLHNRYCVFKRIPGLY